MWQVLALQGKHRHLQAHDPAFGPVVQSSDILGHQVQVHHVVQVGSALLLGEPQIVGVDLEHHASRTPPGEGQRWVCTGRDDQMYLGRQVVEQEGQGTVDGSGFDGVIVLQNQDRVVWQGAQFVDQGGQDSL